MKTNSRGIVWNAAWLIGLFASMLAALLLINTARASALSCDNCVYSGDIVNRTITNLDMANSSVNSRIIVDNSVTSADLAADIAVSTLSTDILYADTIFVSSLFNTDFLNLGDSVVTDIPDNGNIATAAEFELDSADAWAFLGFNCLDANGCNITFGENFIDGDVMFLYNAGSNTVNFADTSGVSELAGNFAAGQWDTLLVIFQFSGASGSWMEISRSNN